MTAWILPMILILLTLGLGAGVVAALQAWRAQPKRAFSGPKFEELLFRVLTLIVAVAVFYSTIRGGYIADPI